MVLGVLGLLAILLLAGLLGKLAPNAPQLPARWRQALIWLAPAAVTLALAYDYSTRHHYRYTATKADISLAGLRALNSTEMAALPLGGALQPGSCQVRMSKAGDGWGNPLMTSTASDELSGTPGGSAYVLGLQTDGPAVVRQVVPGYHPNTNNPQDNFQAIQTERARGTWYDGGIAQSGFQWTLFGRNFQTQSSKLRQQRSAAFNKEVGRLKALMLNDERQEHARPTVPGDPKLRFFHIYSARPDAELNQMALRKHWDCSQEAGGYLGYCEDKQTGRRFIHQKSLEDFCSGFKLYGTATPGKLINLSGPDSTVRMIEAESWFLWITELGGNQEFKGRSVLVRASSLDAGAREAEGQAALVCPDPSAPNEGRKSRLPTIDANLPYTASWQAQLPEKLLELVKFRAIEDHLMQETAAAPEKIKALEAAQRQFNAAQPERQFVSLWARTTRSTPCQATGAEVCRRFNAVLGAQAEAVVLEERCTDRLTAKRASNFSVPMFHW